jgi:hypothetical protein
MTTNAKETSPIGVSKRSQSKGEERAAVNMNMDIDVDTQNGLFDGIFTMGGVFETRIQTLLHLASSSIGMASHGCENIPVL